MQIINTEHFLFLEPLAEWRILDFVRLAELSKVDRYKGYEVVKKLIQRLKEKNVVKVYRDPWTKKSFVYLSNLGEKLVTPGSSGHLVDETLYHDSRVTLICYELKKLSTAIEKVVLEHKIKNYKSKSSFDEIVPDAKIAGKFNNQEFTAAIEVEINQKEKQRIIAKGKKYFESSLYDHAFYFFPDQRILNNYARIFKEGVSINFNKKIFLFYCPEIFNGKKNLEIGGGLALNKTQSIYQLFGKFPMSSLSVPICP